MNYVGGNAQWSDLRETYGYAVIYEASRRRRWWQLWRRKRPKVIFAGPVNFQRSSNN